MVNISLAGNGCIILIVNESGESAVRYTVEIVEKLSTSVEVEASSPEEALGKVTKKYWNAEIVVESRKGADVEFLVSPVREGRISRLFRKLLR